MTYLLSTKLVAEAALTSIVVSIRTYLLQVIQWRDDSCIIQLSWRRYNGATMQNRRSIDDTV